MIDFVDLTDVARRTGRFPQLVDPRSRVNCDGFATISSALGQDYPGTAPAQPVRAPGARGIRPIDIL